MITSALFHGSVMHQRFFPKRHRFVYKLTSWMINIDELDELDSQLTGFGHNRAALFSFHDKDYGPGDGTRPRDFIDQALLQHGLETAHRVELLCQVRALGYLFNPLAVWFCYNQAGELYATLYEVRNTFKQRHHYLVASTEDSLRKWHIADKCFYVSPFMPMDCQYEFRFKVPSNRLALKIRQTHQGSPIMNAVWTGKKERLSQKSLLKQVIRNPISSVKIISAIHWEALRLWIKGLKLVPRPTPPSKPVTEGKDRLQQVAE